MPLFPQYTSIAYLPGVSITPNFNTSISRNEKGGEKRRARWAFPLYDIKVRYDLLTLANARTMWQFYLDRQGPYSTFYFAVPYSDTYEGVYVGTGDGSTVLWTLPMIAGSSVVVYVGGSLQTETVDYSITQEASAEGLDTITFVSAPSAGDHITVDFTGVRAYKVRFADDSLPYEVFYQSLTNMGIDLVGVR